MSSDNLHRQTEDTLRQLVRSGAIEAPPSAPLAAALSGRQTAGTLPDTLKGRLLRTVRDAGVDRRISATRGPVAPGRSVSEHLRLVRTDANLSLEELAGRLSVTAQQLRDAERSATALLAWPDASVADLLELLDTPIHIIAAAVRRPGPLFGPPQRIEHRLAASVSGESARVSAPLFAETARILRERGRDDLLADG
jgi:transcriptional regulator with XRE-family HTH domain